MCKSPGTDQIPAELMQAGDKTLCCVSHTHFNPIRNKEQLVQQWKKAVTV
jgi:hypothetical protein